MKFLILSSNNWHSRQIERAAISLGHDVARRDFLSLQSIIQPDFERISADGIPLDAIDCVFARNMPAGSLEQVVFRMDMLFQICEQGVTVINPPKAIEMAVDKYLCLSRLHEAGIPVPKTWTGQSATDAFGWFRNAKGPVIAKPIFGGEGQGIIRIEKEQEAFELFQRFEQMGQVIYLQEFLSHPGFDIRILVLGNQTWAIKRSNQHDWRTNISRGGLAEVHSPNDLQIKLAMDATRISGCDFAGIDIIELDDGRNFVLEVNAVPGWRAINQVHNVDIAEELVLFAARTRAANA